MKRETFKKVVPFLVVAICCLIVGFLPATGVARESSSYIASMSFSIILLIFICPIMLIFLIIGLLGLIDKDTRKLGAIFLMCCVLLPACFIGSVKVLSLLGYARYDSDKMIPINSELKERIVIIFGKNISREKIHEFDREILRKTVPQPNGELLAFADGVCGILYPQLSNEVTIVDVPFCSDSSEEERKHLKDKVNSSPIVQKVFENISAEDAKNLL